MERLQDKLLHTTPRPLLALAGEIFGVWPVRTGRGLPGLANRLRSLVDARRRPHPLFDAAYYTRAEGGAKPGGWPPFLHFLMRGGFERRKPHPLFDPGWYLVRYPDVAATRQNPLQHYVTFGWKEGRSPHPLFHPKWYKRQYPEANSGGADPLVHFLERGGAEGKKPHPLFDTAWYLRTYPEVRHSGMNPLLHYVTRGAAEGKRPNPNFDIRRYLESHPEAAGAPMDLLSYLMIERYTKSLGSESVRSRLLPQPIPRARTLLLAEQASQRLKDPPPWRNRPVRDCPVFVVYGRPNVEFIESHLLPALAAQQGSFRLHLHTLHYRNQECLLSPRALAYRGGNLKSVTDWSAGRAGGHIGFGESMNYLFAQVRPESAFLMVNPDSMPMEGSIARLLDTFARKPAALVEARQWPMEHPKEFDRSSGETPWASCAFLLMSSEAFQKLGGFDPVYFLYNEDVDLSWRAWLEGMPVVYEPAAQCAHFTGILTRNFHRFQRQDFFMIRNFMVIAYKFFGERGEGIARTWIRHMRLPPALERSIEQSYLAIRGSVRRVDTRRVHHPEKIKILGMNLYHQLRDI